MSNQHSEWLSLVPHSGPFVAEPVLDQVFPQGLEVIDPPKRKVLRQAYNIWREALDTEDSALSEIHQIWIKLVLTRGLELDDEVLRTKETIANSLVHELPEHSITLRPDYAVVDDQHGDNPMLLIQVYDSSVKLEDTVQGDGWATTPAERMAYLCKATKTRLGMVTNGEHWLLVDAPDGGVTTYASWYAGLWGQEPVTLQAFVALLGVSRYFCEEDRKLPCLIDESVKHQDEVTESLGAQVRRAVEVLIQAFDKSDETLDRQLLKDVDPKELYEASLTIMMRLVFLLCAEERELIDLMREGKYLANYAISTLRQKLRDDARQYSEEVLDHRYDAWSRLLSIFRAVYGGIEHETLRLPALGGSLFDPDRFPFLEGRSKGSNWKTEPAAPLPIDNRTVMFILEAIQLFRGRTLSYRALDVEQIGYVYEGLLERTVVRAEDVTLELSATSEASEPWVTLSDLESAKLESDDAIVQLLKERTVSSESRVCNDIAREVQDADSARLLTACRGDVSLRDRIKPYFHLIRTDRWDYPIVYPKAAFRVVAGANRRETGTHYTPKVLTEAIVKETLEPVVYIGPAEGVERKDWKLKSPSALLDLKICDPAMGSGAFLVQVCRYLSERLVEAWMIAENEGNAITSEGAVTSSLGGNEPISKDVEDRMITAKRLIAERCLYGVDMNPLAVELAKLSIWLITLSKGRPFGFLDHNLRSGDSLLGIHSLRQLIDLEIDPKEKRQERLFGQAIRKSVEEALEFRKQLRGRPIRDIQDVKAMATLDTKARSVLELPELIADAFIGSIFSSAGSADLDSKLVNLAILADDAMKGDDEKITIITRNSRHDLASDSPNNIIRHPFHWPLEFPEVFDRNEGGFDVIVGNPPFLGDTRMRKILGPTYRKFLLKNIAGDKKGKVDLVVYFFLKQYKVLRVGGVLGFLATYTLSHGDSRKIGLQQIVEKGGVIYKARTSIKWPGKASLMVHQVHICRDEWQGEIVLNDKTVEYISPYLKSIENWDPQTLKSNLNLIYEGTAPNGEGFLLTKEKAEELLRENPNYKDILYPYIIARQVNQNYDLSTNRWIINFWDWSKEDSSKYEKAFSIVKKEVKPIRQRKNINGEFVLRSPLPQKWWLHKEKRPSLYHAIGRGNLFKDHPKEWDPNNKMKQVLVMARGATKYPCFTFLENKFIYGDSLCVIATENYEMLSVLSSDIHTIWAWQEGGRKESRLRYTQESTFEKFPFPEDLIYKKNVDLARVGEKMFRLRQKYMLNKIIGMTSFYNDFHNPEIQNSSIDECRNHQVIMNDTVLCLYEWDDLNLEHGFHEVEYLPDGENVRFTISEGAREELLFRLSILNRKNHQKESDIDALSKARTIKSKTKKRKKKMSSPAQQSLLGDDES